MKLTPKELVIAFTAVHFVSEPETYPIWRAYTESRIGAVFDTLPDIPERSEIQLAATKLMSAAFSSFSEEDRKETADLLKEVLERKRPK